MPADRTLPHLVLCVVVLFGCGGEGREREQSASTWRFTDVTDAAGLGDFRHETGAIGKYWIPESIGSGAAFTDIDGDGWIDVVLVRGGFVTDTTADGSPVPKLPALAAYRNQSDGTFRDVTREVGLSDLVAYGQGLQSADFDGDGDQDLFLTTLGRNVLLRNDGGRYVDVSATSGLADTEEWSTAAAFFDADGDGDLDLYVGNYVEWSIENDVFCSLDTLNKTYCTPNAYRGIPGRYYRNEGDGTFVDRTLQDGFGRSAGNTLGAVAVDYNRDGAMDLYVTNDLRPNLLYQNRGDGTFEEVALAAGAAYDERGHARAGMGVDAGIVDSTGRLTLFIGNFSKEPIGVFQHAEERVFLPKESAMRLLRPSLPTLTFALFLFDANLDGHLDLFAVNGHVQPDIEQSDRTLKYRQPVHLFLNNGDGTFHDAAPELGPPLTSPLAGRGGAYADFDQDGDLDLLVTENGGGVHLWRNDLPGNEDGVAPSVRIQLRPSRSNPDGTGARVIGWIGGRGIEQHRRSGASYLSTSETIITMGLGEAPALDSMVVHWPSGVRSTHGSIPAGSLVKLDEP